MAKNDCIRPGDWRDVYPTTVSRLYEWGAWRYGDYESETTRDSYSGPRGFPSVQPMFSEMAEGYRDDRSSVFEFDADRALECDEIIRLELLKVDRMFIRAYYADRLPYTDLAAMFEVSDKKAKRTLGELVKRIDAIFNSIKNDTGN